MQEQLSWIEIKDYKCFKDFKVEGFKRVNLIGGKNNVGKTAFMEACYITTKSKDVPSFANTLKDIKSMRENLNILSALANGKFIHTSDVFLEATKKFHTQSNIRYCQFELKDDNGKKFYIFDIDKLKSKINAKEFSFSNFKSNINFLDSFGISEEELIIFYQAIQLSDKELELGNIIKKLDNSIENFKIIGDKPKCKVNEKYIELTEFGDGLKHLISIVCMMYGCKDGALFIDEIDNGLHYTLLPEIWELVFNLSKELNCQVFATTHSKECIEAFNNANKEDDGVYFELFRNYNNIPDYNTLNNTQLTYELNHNGRIRGE